MEKCYIDHSGKHMVVNASDIDPKLGDYITFTDIPDMVEQYEITHVLGGYDGRMYYIIKLVKEEEKK